MSTRDVFVKNRALQIKEFDLESLCPNPSICMVAKRGSGKSWVCRALLKHHKYLPGGVIIAATEKMSPFYGKFFPELFIHYEYSSDLVQKILDRQEAIIKKCRERYEEHKKVDPRAFLLMDDCLADSKSWIRERPILEIFQNGRHYQLMYILTMQYPLGIPPILRSNFDYIFLLADDMFSTQKKIFDQYAGMFPDFDTFRQVYDVLTQDYGSMVVINRGIRKNITDKIAWFKASNEECDMIGCKQFVKFHELNYNKEWNSKDKGPTSIDLNKKKNKKLLIDKVSH